MLGLLNGTFSPDLLVDDILDLPVDVIASGLVTDIALAFLHDTLGIPILVDTINDKATMQAFLAKPIDGIITDRPDLLLEITRPVPEPSTVWMLLSGLGTAAFFNGRRRSTGRKGDSHHSGGAGRNDKLRETIAGRSPGPHGPGISPVLHPFSRMRGRSACTCAWMWTARSTMRPISSLRCAGGSPTL
ncbi:MAG: PEP-CTERM sorting domain-containing protein [Betaproteobacteria bacterium]|nr:PEP-CTERM sorting domain-containing protein [Betaproteobacteria bacterium]